MTQVNAQNQNTKKLNYIGKILNTQERHIAKDGSSFFFLTFKDRKGRIHEVVAFGKARDSVRALKTSHVKIFGTFQTVTYQGKEKNQIRLICVVDYPQGGNSSDDSNEPDLFSASSPYASKRDLDAPRGLAYVPEEGDEDFYEEIPF